jgi:hypothetical protein
VVYVVAVYGGMVYGGTVEGCVEGVEGDVEAEQVVVICAAVSPAAYPGLAFSRKVSESWMRYQRSCA